MAAEPILVRITSNSLLPIRLSTFIGGLLAAFPIPMRQPRLLLRWRELDGARDPADDQHGAEYVWGQESRQDYVCSNTKGCAYAIGSNRPNSAFQEKSGGNRHDIEPRSGSIAARPGVACHAQKETWVR